LLFYTQVGQISPEKEKEGLKC